MAVRDLTHRFVVRGGRLTVLDGLDLEVEAGGHVALMGQSGAGKSTLLALLGGLERPQEGSVVVDGHDLTGLSRDELAAFRRESVGFVFQHFGLLETLSAVENVELACTLAGVARRVRGRRARDLLASVGLGERAGHRPGELSGGERQRVAIARALANHPRVVLADEPTGNLDEDSTTMVVELLESLPAEHGCTLVVVTHNRALARRAGRLLALRGGRLQEAASV
ncbi:MAG: ABC transporter ATP-binding protein [Acidimicrobiia bacterium]|nr:ABC transporter ATP-binding protein [Acidimicrobiia bacterium]MBA3956542.1 ABC transporter ATP-binding protein [Acidimicrobiia bacterium]